VRSKLNGERAPLANVDQSGEASARGSKGMDPRREIEVVETPSRMMAELYCFLPGGHPVCFVARCTRLVRGGRGVPGF